MSKRIFLTLTLVLCLLFVVGFLLYTRIEIAHENFPNEIKLSKNGKVQETLTIDNLDLCPGAVDERVLTMTCDADGDYGVSLDFNLKENGELARFIVVDLQCNGQNFQFKLDELFAENKTVEFDCTLYSEKKTEIIIRYTLPLEVGDEAQGADVIFDIDLTASHK